ncbi:MAG: AIG2-like family [Idiomarinaceae bacterium HL-53]|nr:MAG: AIG2-like family [Idiomarinaceae bacterium HL-53]CUS49160.1 Gamma-glutamyl cyclotransferase, AIG2-like [Idiomarinaceae bacterium HL-53]
MLISALLIGITIFAAWWTWVSPYNFTYSETTLTLEPEAEHRVFVFGTLKNPIIRSFIMRTYAPTERALLPGYQKTKLDLKPNAEANTEGVVFYATSAQLRRLDRYERVGVKYERYCYTLANGDEAWVYRLISHE